MKEYNLEGFERGLFELGITLSESDGDYGVRSGDYEAFSRQSVAGEGL